MCSFILVCVLIYIYIYFLFLFFGWPDFKAINSISPKPHPIYHFRRKHSNAASLMAPLNQLNFNLTNTFTKHTKAYFQLQKNNFLHDTKRLETKNVPAFPTPQLPPISEVRIDTITIRLTTGAIHARLALSTSCAEKKQLLIWGCSLNQMISGNVSWGDYASNPQTHHVGACRTPICMRSRLQKILKNPGESQEKTTFWRDIISLHHIYNIYRCVNTDW